MPAELCVACGQCITCARYVGVMIVCGVMIAVQVSFAKLTVLVCNAFFHSRVCFTETVNNRDIVQ